MNVMDLDNMSDEGHVEEISMDDFMDTLIEAMDMGPSGMAGQGYYNSGMGGFQGGFNMGPTSSPSPFAFSMYGSYPQGYGHPVQGNGQPGNGPWAAEPGYPTQENSTTEEQPAGQPIS